MVRIRSVSGTGEAKEGVYRLRESGILSLIEDSNSGLFVIDLVSPQVQRQQATPPSVT